MTAASTQRPQLDRDEVAAALGPQTLGLLQSHGVPGRQAGREFKTCWCPACGDVGGSRPGDVSINLLTGRWLDRPRACKGDVFALVAALEGLDFRRDFPQVLARAAELAGVSAPDRPLTAGEQTHRRELLARRAEARQVEEVAEKDRRQQQSIATATPYWGRLATRSRQGEQYLAWRGVLDVLGAEVVRFTDRGDVALALFTADGQVVNVVRRRIGNEEPKVLGMKGCPTAGTFVDSIADITHGRDVVLVEGLFDAITARLAWPDAVVLGAHGASNVPKVAAAAVPRIKLAQSRLLLVPHEDVAGVNAMTAAGRLAIAGGLQLHKDLIVVVEFDGPDLNDAWRTGWRPQ